MEIKNGDKPQKSVKGFQLHRFVPGDSGLSGEERYMDYNLFLPQDYQNGRKYPLVLFMHDMGSCYSDPQEVVRREMGAYIWAEPEEQHRHPCIVVVPCYTRKTADDNFTTTWEAEATIELVKSLIANFPVDTRFVYGTGQSMGCMMLCNMMLQHPGFFSASIMVAGQWDPFQMAKLKNENLWILVSEKDEKAYPIMKNAIRKMEEAGAKVLKNSLPAWAPDAWDSAVRSMMAKNRPVHFTEISEPDEETGQAISPCSYHKITWQRAYGIQAIRDWLFTQTKRVDFSAKHHILIESDDGNRQPMDEPYFLAAPIGEGSWQILSDGVFSYLVEGDDEAIVIDSGYGCGNIREFCQSLTKRPVRRIINTHDHFDHTANNGYFDCALMSKESVPLATIAPASFQGITFPRDYPITVVGDGDVIDLGNHTLEVFRLADHAVGSLVFLDKKLRILFCGDEFGMGNRKFIRGTVKGFLDQLRPVAARREDYDILCCGNRILPAGYIDRFVKNMEYILAGNPGAAVGNEPAVKQGTENETEKNIQTVYGRKKPRRSDWEKEADANAANKRIMNYAGCAVIYYYNKIIAENEIIL
ncbi:MAG: MBL fold metallo-hydrolase [Lachnospiraceae bacterium]|nr:MBL fold metallo-hydrolase [Lachnospiraceae bacterium]